MNNISIEIYEYFDDVLKSYKLGTEFFFEHCNTHKYAHIKEKNDEIVLELDITMPNTDNMLQYTLSIPELKEKGISCSYERYESVFDNDKFTKKYMLNISISKYFIRNFKLKKLFL